MTTTTTTTKPRPTTTPATPAQEAPQVSPAAAAERVRRWERAFDESFPERATVREALLDCWLAGLHAQILGPPGTAKTTSVRAIARSFRASSFYVQLHRQLPIEEIFGPLDVRAFQQGEYRRVHDGYAASADLVILDEIFKAGPTTLNPLLTFLEDRLVKQNGREILTPMRVCVGISNELPSDSDQLEALADRFVARVWVDNLQDDAAWQRMVADQLPLFVDVLEPEVLACLVKRASTLPVAASATEALRAIVVEARQRGVRCSDRRSKKALALMRARAARTGAAEVTVAHVDAAESTLWNKRDEMPIVREIVRKHAAPWQRDVQDVARILDELRATFADAMRAKQSREAAATAIVKINVRLQDVRANEIPRIAIHGGDAARAADDLTARVSGFAREVVAAGARLGILSA